MQFKNQWVAEALATPACPLDSREEAIFEALGGPRSWIEDSSFGADADTAAADQRLTPEDRSVAKAEVNVVELAFPNSVSLSRRPQYVIGLLGICLVFAPMLEALGTHINFGFPLRIGGILAVVLTVAAAVQIEQWVLCAQVALGLALFGLGCFGPTDAIVDIFSCCVFGILIAFLAAMQAENVNAARSRRDDFGQRTWR